MKDGDFHSYVKLRVEIRILELPDQWPGLRNRLIMIDWSYPPYVRSMQGLYVGEYPYKIWPYGTVLPI